MLSRRPFVAMTAFLVLPILATAADDKKDETKDKKDDKRGGTVTGVVTAKGDNWIEVKGDGEEKGRKYVPHWRGGNPADGGGPDKKMLAEIKAVPVKSRVRLEWTFEERPRVEKIEVLKKAEMEKKKEQSRRGTVTGVVTAKGDIWLEVKGDGEEKARRYIPHWHGGNPADGGGLDKKVLAEIDAVPVKSRVRLEWVSAEGPRVEKVEILNKPDSEK